MLQLKAAIISLIASIGLTSTTLFSMPPEITIELGDKECDSLLLVSSWNNNNVKIYDGCSGTYIRDLLFARQNLINGPLALLEAPDGDLLVISENNSRLLKFDRKTLSKGSVVMSFKPNTQTSKNNFISKPSAAVIDDQGYLYAASYGLNSVVKIDTKNWEIIDELLAENNDHIKGIDAGIVLNDGHLFLPGYDSDNIIKINLKTKAITEVVSKGLAGLNAPRMILFQGKDMLVSSERNNSIMVFNAETGTFKHTLIEVGGPRGLVQDGEQHILINTKDAVFRATNDGEKYQKIVKNGAGGLKQGVFVYRLRKSWTTNKENQ